MTTIAFDTLKYADRLEAAGVPRAQAKVQAEALAEVIGGAEVITRDYLDARLAARIREAELKLEAKIADSKADLTRWVVGAGILQTSLIIGVLLKVAKLI
jgi:hypothetical protein